MLDNKSEQEPMTEDKYAHPWSFSVWTAVKADASVPSYSSLQIHSIRFLPLPFLFLMSFLVSGMAGASQWIWSEGVPAQIPLWKAKRVLLLQKVPFPKSFNPVRMFGGLSSVAEVALDSHLDLCSHDTSLFVAGQVGAHRQ